MLPLMQEYFAMDGYALFVWGAYGLGLAVVAGLAALSLAGRRAAARALEAARATREENAP